MRFFRSGESAARHRRRWAHGCGGGVGFGFAAGLWTLARARRGHRGLRAGHHFPRGTRWRWPGQGAGETVQRLSDRRTGTRHQRAVVWRGWLDLSRARPSRTKQIPSSSPQGHGLGKTSKKRGAECQFHKSERDRNIPPPYAKIFWMICPWTSVRRKSRPWKRWVRRV